MESSNYIEGAIFTVTLGSLVENGFDLQLTDYPIFDEKYREVLNGKIYRRYWMREIGQETPAMFRFFLKRRLDEIMPYYNQLYLSTLHEFDPFSNYDMTTTGNSVTARNDVRTNAHDETSESTSDATSTGTNTGRTVLSNTPQMQLSGLDDYATSLTDTTGETLGTSRGSDTANRRLTEHDVFNGEDTNDYITHVAGVSGILKADALMRFRESLLNVDVMLLEELAPLFFGLYTDYMNAF